MRLTEERVDTMLTSPGRQTVLIVDDTPSNLSIIHALLREDYDTLVATSGRAALELVRTGRVPDLVLLDVVMPEMDGYLVCAKLKISAATRDVPVIFLTASSGPEDEIKGFQAGAVDYITKPISAPTLLARVRTHLSLVEARRALRRENVLLELKVLDRTREIRMLQEATIVALASLAETRDNETGNHIRRTQRYVRCLAEEMRKQPRFRDVLDDAWIESMYQSSALHDIGKVGIPDRVLLKPGRLTPDEFAIMRTHARLGRDAIASAEKHLESESTFLVLAAEIALGHHEKWDGSGYPAGLAGEAIPLSARLMAVADVYDALISRRVYKEAFSHEEAVATLREGRGVHFDPDVLEAFEQVSDEFRALAGAWPDSEEEVERKARQGDLEDGASVAVL